MCECTSVRCDEADADSRGKSAPELPADGPQPTVVTECWVEACIYEKALLSPEGNVIFRPLPFDTPLAGAEAITAHVSGFPTDQAVYLRRMLKAAGELRA